MYEGVEPEISHHRLGYPQAFDDWREMLEIETFDIIIVASENALHPAIVEACAATGARVCVEKPMATSLSAALRMACAVSAAGIEMAVDQPATCVPEHSKLKQLIDGGAIGRVLEVKYR